MLEKEIIAAANRLGLGIFREIVRSAASRGLSPNPIFAPLHLFLSLCMLTHHDETLPRELLAKSLSLPEIPEDKLEEICALLTHSLKSYQSDGYLFQSCASFWGMEDNPSLSDFNERYAVMLQKAPASPAGITAFLQENHPGCAADLTLALAAKYLVSAQSTRLESCWSAACAYGLPEDLAFFQHSTHPLHLLPAVYQGKLASLELPHVSVASLPLATPGLALYLLQPETDLPGFMERISYVKLLDWTSRLVPAQGQLLLPPIETCQIIRLDGALQKALQFPTDEPLAKLDFLQGNHLHITSQPPEEIVPEEEEEKEEEQILIQVRQPFFYFVRDTLSEAILFYGILQDPAWT